MQLSTSWWPVSFLLAESIPSSINKKQSVFTSLWHEAGLIKRPGKDSLFKMKSEYTGRYYLLTTARWTNTRHKIVLSVETFGSIDRTLPKWRNRILQLPSFYLWMKTELNFERRVFSLSAESSNECLMSGKLALRLLKLTSTASKFTINSFRQFIYKCRVCVSSHLIIQTWLWLWIQTGESLTNPNKTVKAFSIGIDYIQLFTF